MASRAHRREHARDDVALAEDDPLDVLEHRAKLRADVGDPLALALLRRAAQVRRGRLLRGRLWLLRRSERLLQRSR